MTFSNYYISIGVLIYPLVDTEFCCALKFHVLNLDTGHYHWLQRLLNDLNWILNDQTDWIQNLVLSFADSWNQRLATWKYIKRMHPSFLLFDTSSLPRRTFPFNESNFTRTNSYLNTPRHHLTVLFIDILDPSHLWSTFNKPGSKFNTLHQHYASRAC